MMRLFVKVLLNGTAVDVVMIMMSYYELLYQSTNHTFHTYGTGSYAAPATLALGPGTEGPYQLGLGLGAPSHWYGCVDVPIACEMIAKGSDMPHLYFSYLNSINVYLYQCNVYHLPSAVQLVIATIKGLFRLIKIKIQYLAISTTTAVLTQPLPL